MIDFVDTPSFLKKALQVAMATMHFHIAQTGLFMGKYFRIQGVPGNNLVSIQNCPWGARYVKLDPEVDGLRPILVYLLCFFYDFHLIFKGFITILEYANEVISYTTTR